MDRIKKKRLKRQKVKKGIRAKIVGTPQRPRLNVFRSNKEIYSQLIDDDGGHTLVAASSLGDQIDNKKQPTEIAKEVGQKLAEKAKEAQIEEVVFDRNGYLYHGRVKALAEGAREGGLKF